METHGPDSSLATRDLATETVMDYAGIIRRRRWIVISVAMVVIVVSMLISFTTTPSYTATSRVLVKPLSSNPTAYFTINLETERGLAQSTKSGDVVAARTNSTRPVSELLGGLSVTLEPDTEILNITYSSPEAKESALMANAFADAYLEFRRADAIAQYGVESQELRSRIADLNDERRSLTERINKANDAVKVQILLGERAALDDRVGRNEEMLASLEDPTALQSGGGEVLDRATVPGAPSTPNHARDLFFALSIGLLLGIAAAVTRDRFDPTLHGSEDLERRLGAPVLATIPRIEDWRERAETELVMRTDPTSPAAEAYRALRTNLQFVARRNGARMLAITSPFQGEGKTTTVANLAMALGQTGKRVIAVSCDLRRPRLHRFFECNNEFGVTDVLVGATLEEAMQRPQGMENVLVLASGPVPPNPAELLGSDEMSDLLATLRGTADYILLDLPPLLAVADGLILAQMADGVVVIVDAAATARGAAVSVRNQLEQVGALIVGGVFNNFDPSTSRTYAYDYRTRYPYSYGVYESDGGERKSRRRKSSTTEPSEPGPDGSEDHPANPPGSMEPETPVESGSTEAPAEA